MLGFPSCRNQPWLSYRAWRPAKTDESRISNYFVFSTETATFDPVEKGTKAVSSWNFRDSGGPTFNNLQADFSVEISKQRVFQQPQAITLIYEVIGRVKS